MNPTGSVSPSVRPVAFYLPQFHPIPENDEWWGTGFTEWRNVATTRPQFEGHRQPRHPRDLGYYDLRLDEIRSQQEQLAQAAGIHAWCYYHYWFEGTRLLERPLERMMQQPGLTMPFMVCWANQNWSRLWNGGDEALLIEQRYSPEDDVAHIRHLLPTLAHERYLRIDGRPVLAVYRPEELPAPQRTADVWRTESQRAGIDLYLCSVESPRFLDEQPAPETFGCDAAIEFLPQRHQLGRRLGFESRVRGVVRRTLLRRTAENRNHMFDYRQVLEIARQATTRSHTRFLCAMPGWDNTARNQNGGARIIVNSTPELYEELLRLKVSQTRGSTPDENLVFINAWNEWAEAAYLEPDLESGDAYLRATARVLVGN